VGEEGRYERRSHVLEREREPAAGGPLKKVSEGPH
jgi:hypothetical protein